MDVYGVFTLYPALSSLATYLGLLVLTKIPAFSTPQLNVRLLWKCMHYKARERWVLQHSEEQLKRSLLWARAKVFEMQVVIQEQWVHNCSPRCLGGRGGDDRSLGVQDLLSNTRKRKGDAQGCGESTGRKKHG